MIPVYRSYSCRIPYQAPYPTSKKIEDKAFRWSNNLDVESFQGNPACHPYVEAKGEHEQDVVKWRDKMIRYIGRFKDVQIEGLNP